MARKRIDQRTRAARDAGRKAREELLTAALAVFARRGYAAAGVDAIAAEAGYSKGAVYWHFAGGKADLLLALLAERVDAPLLAVLDVIAGATADEDIAVIAAAALHRQLREQRDALVLDRELWSLALRDPELKDRYAERRSALRRRLGETLVARAARHGLTLPAPAEDLAQIVMAVVDGLTADELLQPGSGPAARLDLAFGLLWAGVAGASGRPAPSSG